MVVPPVGMPLTKHSSLRREGSGGWAAAEGHRGPPKGAVGPPRALGEPAAGLQRAAGGPSMVAVGAGWPSVAVAASRRTGALAAEDALRTLHKPPESPPGLRDADDRRQPPSDFVDAARFQEDCYDHMQNIANMATLAKKANKTEDAERHDMELMVLKSALASLQPVREQKRDFNWKLGETRDKMASTQSRIRDLVATEREIEMEIAQLESCKNELEEMQVQQPVQPAVPQPAQQDLIKFLLSMDDRQTKQEQQMATLMGPGSACPDHAALQGGPAVANRRGANSNETVVAYHAFCASHADCADLAGHRGGGDQHAGFDCGSSGEKINTARGWIASEAALGTDITDRADGRPGAERGGEDRCSVQISEGNVNGSIIGSSIKIDGYERFGTCKITIDSGPLSTIRAAEGSCIPGSDPGLAQLVKVTWGLACSKADVSTGRVKAHCGHPANVLVDNAAEAAARGLVGPPRSLPDNLIQAVSFCTSRPWGWLCADCDVKSACPEVLIDGNSIKLEGTAPTARADLDEEPQDHKAPPPRVVEIAVGFKTATFNAQSLRQVHRRGAKGRNRARRAAALRTQLQHQGINLHVLVALAPHSAHQAAVKRAFWTRLKEVSAKRPPNACMIDGNCHLQGEGEDGAAGGWGLTGSMGAESFRMPEWLDLEKVKAANTFQGGHECDYKFTAGKSQTKHRIDFLVADEGVYNCMSEIRVDYGVDLVRKQDGHFPVSARIRQCEKGSIWTDAQDLGLFGAQSELGKDLATGWAKLRNAGADFSWKRLGVEEWALHPVKFISETKAVMLEALDRDYARSLESNAAFLSDCIDAKTPQPEWNTAHRLLLHGGKRHKETLAFPMRIDAQGKKSTIACFLDLTAASYSVMKQFILRLPAEEEELREALSQVGIPEALFIVSNALEGQPILDHIIEDEHLLEMVRDTQAGAFWKVREATAFARPALGTRPGTTLAADGFNVGFKQVIAGTEHDMKQACLDWHPDEVAAHFCTAGLELDWQLGLFWMTSRLLPLLNVLLMFRSRRAVFESDLITGSRRTIRTIATPRAGVEVAAVDPHAHADNDDTATDETDIEGATTEIASVDMTHIAKQIEHHSAQLDHRLHAQTLWLNETHGELQRLANNCAQELAEDLFDITDLGTFFSRRVLSVKLRRLATLGKEQIAAATAQLTATANSFIAQQQQLFNAQVHEFLAASEQNASHPEFQTLQRSAAEHREQCHQRLSRRRWRNGDMLPGCLLINSLFMGTCPNDGFTYKFKAEQPPLLEPWQSLAPSSRVALLTITSDKDNFTMDLMNAHNSELDDQAQDNILAKWMELAVWSLQDPSTGAFLAAGGFNAMSGAARSYVDPIAEGSILGSVPADLSRGSQPLQAYWERLFFMLTEVSTDCPTHYCRDTATAATLDRIFIGRIFALRAMARCIWRNDIHAAQKLKATAADGARFFHVSNGDVGLLDRQEFALIANAANYEFGQMDARLAEHRASKEEGAVVEGERSASTKLPLSKIAYLLDFRLSPNSDTPSNLFGDQPLALINFRTQRGAAPAEKLPAIAGAKSGNKFQRAAEEVRRRQASLHVRNLQCLHSLNDEVLALQSQLRGLVTQGESMRIPSVTAAEKEGAFQLVTQLLMAALSEAARLAANPELSSQQVLEKAFAFCLALQHSRELALSCEAKTQALKLASLLDVELLRQIFSGPLRLRLLAAGAARSSGAGTPLASQQRRGTRASTPSLPSHELRRGRVSVRGSSDHWPDAVEAFVARILQGLAEPLVSPKAPPDKCDDADSAPTAAGDC
ncbi:unnamed protein product [Prorocentrum cordatum]|uniref:Uncharacterized protein n=1 Tax=Prorocentrum cordatum TaxID=2364126 RepID=A0ABN9SJ56_9DINO|nr:unnamed protein product [Polarella glacialis]